MCAILLPKTSSGVVHRCPETVPPGDPVCQICLSGPLARPIRYEKSQRTEGFLIGQVTVANPLQTSPRHRTDTAWSFGTQVRAADLTLNSPPLSSVNATFARVLNGRFWEALRNASYAKPGGPFSPSDSLSSRACESAAT
jgi:hypothetical protein